MSILCKIFGHKLNFSFGNTLHCSRWSCGYNKQIVTRPPPIPVYSPAKCSWRAKIHPATIEEIARILCIECGCLPDVLEPGNLSVADDLCNDRSPRYYTWRDYIPLSKKIIKIVKNEELIKEVL